MARLTDVYVVSYPKSGRTWLRLLVGRSLQQHFALGEADLLETDALALRRAQVPVVRFTHDGKAHERSPDEPAHHEQYRDHDVVLLVRDPRDVLVSHYHQLRNRRDRDLGTLGEFIRSRVGGAETLLAFYRSWARDLEVPRNLLLLRYEDLHRDTAAELRRVLAFMGVEDVSQQVVDEAVHYASFDNMRDLELSGATSSPRLTPGRAGDEGLKTRKGRVGGHIEELEPDDIAWLDARIREEIPDLFGYTR